MGTLVTYRRSDEVATITMDDGKVNALSRPLLTELGAALDRAAADGAVVVLTGRPGVLSAGFNRAVLLAEVFGPEDAVAAGFLDRVVPPAELAEAAATTAAQLATLDLDAHAASKLRARRQALTALRDAIDRDDAEYLARAAAPTQAARAAG
jgi:enoyl-CoA hydratase/carnithine racemase